MVVSVALFHVLILLSCISLLSFYSSIMNYSCFIHIFIYIIYFINHFLFLVSDCSRPSRVIKHFLTSLVARPSCSYVQDSPVWQAGRPHELASETIAGLSRLTAFLSAGRSHAHTTTPTAPASHSHPHPPPPKILVSAHLQVLRTVPWLSSTCELLQCMCVACWFAILHFFYNISIALRLRYVIANQHDVMRVVCHETLLRYDSVTLW
jgi:hypothetical protein